MDKPTESAVALGPDQWIPTPRKIPFEFPDDLEPHWNPNDLEFSAMVNGASLTMPYLEPFLVKTIRDASGKSEDAFIKETGKAFNTQEQHHYRAHRRFNDLIKSKGYPELAAIESDMKAHYANLSKKSLRTRLAYTAGFETMTLGVTKWLIENRCKLFSGSDSRVASFILWHFVEESEHKCVAHDVYESNFSHGFSNYVARALGVFHGSAAVAWYSMRGYKAILVKDGLWTNLRSRLRLARRLGGFMRYVAPYLFRAIVPGHNPRQEKELQWVKDWMAGYETFDHDKVPLLDTQHPEIPVPFNNSNSNKSNLIRTAA